MTEDRRRSVPSVDRLLSEPALAAARASWSHRTVVAVVRREIERARREVAGGGTAPGSAELAQACARRLAELESPRPRRVINATGVVIHTNLGRAPLAADAIDAVARVAAGYSDLEYDVVTGSRGSRHAHVAEVLALLFPGRAALVVNNNAAAVLLALNTLALGREVVVSRGELVEIGGSFRVPEILERSGSRLVEVGTTNRTHPADYERALSDGTGVVLKVWPSNYRVIGFTREVGVAELARVAHGRGLPVVVDQGCGRLFKDGPGPRSERSVEELLEEGADLVCFSGDKLLGGPQSGVLVGDPGLVARCAKNPLARALRPGKLTLAALAATCRGWLRRDPVAALPAVAMLERGADDLRPCADALGEALRAAAPAVSVDVVPGVSRVGGGSAPEEDLPTWLVAVRWPGGEERLADALRAAEPPIVARVADGALLLDPRTLLPGEDREVVDAIVAATAVAAGREDARSPVD